MVRDGIRRLISCGVLLVACLVLIQVAMFAQQSVNPIRGMFTATGNDDSIIYGGVVTNSYALVTVTIRTLAPEGSPVDIRWWDEDGEHSLRHPGLWFAPISSVPSSITVYAKKVVIDNMSTDGASIVTGTFQLSPARPGAMTTHTGSFSSSGDDDSIIWPGTHDNRLVDTLMVNVGALSGTSPVDIRWQGADAVEYSLRDPGQGVFSSPGTRVFRDVQKLRIDNMSTDGKAIATGTYTIIIFF